MMSAMSKSKKTDHHDIAKRLHGLSHSKDQLANTILALMVSTAELSLGTMSLHLLEHAWLITLIVLTNVVNYFLGSEDVAKIASLAKSNDAKALEGYVCEALRRSFHVKGNQPRLIISAQVLTQLSGVSSVGFLSIRILNLSMHWCYYSGVASKDCTTNGRDFKKADRVFLDIVSANLDVSKAFWYLSWFSKVDVLCRRKCMQIPVAAMHRDRLKIVFILMACSSKVSCYSVLWESCWSLCSFTSYLGEGLTIKVNNIPSFRNLLFMNVTSQIATEVMRAVFECDGLRRAPGHSGCLNR